MTTRMMWAAAPLCAMATLAAVPLHAQAAPLSRADAVRSALARGPRAAVARADTLAAAAALLTARAFLNPSLATTYSQSTPQYHVSVDLPLELPGLRRARVGSAEASRTAARYLYLAARAGVALEADTTYTLALAASARAALSRRTAQDADSLRRLAALRRDAGDASDLDVELATISAGQQANVAASDSLAAIGALLDLQTVIGIASDGVAVEPTDSLAPPGGPAPEVSAPAVGVSPGSAGRTTRPASATLLPVAAAEASLAAAELSASVQRRSVYAAPALTAGFETHDPSGSETGILPTFGVALPLPFFSRNGGPIALADAERVRARAELARARIEAQAQVARATRGRAAALARVERDRSLVASANRVAALSLTAYREGASTLPNVLEAQRSAREVLAQYVDDVAAAANADALLRALTLTTESRNP